MTLCSRDVGKRFVAPSGREVEFVGERNERFIFAYVDEPGEYLAFAADGLRILDEAPRGTREMN
jgi:hypothetical protein